MTFKNLLSPIKIGTMEVKNRFVVPPMGTNYATKDGFVTDQLIDYIAARAKGGFGLIIMEVTAVDPLARSIPNEVGIWSDDHIPGWKRLVNEAHKYGAKIAVQLHHAGRQTTKAILQGEQPVAPSAVACPITNEVPIELTNEETWNLIQKFRDGARRAIEIGFDAIEIHGAHGYLIAQYMSPQSNKRIDEFGGDFMGRMKFPIEIIKAIKMEVGPGFPLLFRMSGDEEIEGGRSQAETGAIARLLVDHGIDALHISACTYESGEWMHPTAAFPPGYLVNLAADTKKSVDVPIITVGRITNPYLAEDIVQKGNADMISLGRESICDPEIPNKVAAGAIDEIAPCIYCLQGCIGQLVDPNVLKISCLVNAFTGNEGTMKIEKAESAKEVMIVGSGVAGLEAAWIAAKRGHKVTCYEKDSVLGGKYRIAGIPTTKQDIMAAIKYYITMGKKYGVKYITDTEVTEELVKKESPDVIILATGSKPLKPKSIRGIDNSNFLMATDVIDGKIDAWNDKYLVVGGGMIGSETAEFLGERGRDVTIIEMLDEIAAEMVYIPKAALKRRLAKYNVKTITGAKVKELGNNFVIFEKDGKDEKVEGFDKVVLALGTVSHNPLEENLKDKCNEVYVIGDALNADKAITAIANAARIAISI